MRKLIKNLIRFLLKRAGHSLVLRSLIASLLYIFAFAILRVDKRKTVGSNTLIDDEFIHRFMMSAGALMLTYGFKGLALRSYQALQNTNSAHSPKQIVVANQVGVTQFLKGDYKECLNTFQVKQKRLDDIITTFDLKDVNVEFLDDSWTLAIGHIAHIDTYIKSKVLLGNKNKTIMFDNFGSLPDGFSLIRFYKKNGLKMLTARSTSERLQLASQEADRPLGEAQFVALQRSFWYGAHEGDIELFGKYGAEVQRNWHEAGKKPLAKSTTAQYDQFREEMFELFGLPKEAWFVTLHVREPGYHKHWHNTHPTTRNAIIASYEKAIQFITSSGGWVIRAGDPSMQPLPEQANVIDYAVSPHRYPSRDIQLCEFCRFFIGTNSGFSLVPGIFGTPSLLSNWSPIAIPNWFPFDIMVPKKVWNQNEKRYLSAREMLENFTGWSQFKKDFTGTGFILEDNTPEEIMHATVEMLEITSANHKKAQKHTNIIARQAYQRLIEEKCGYTGSEISYSFIRDNPWFIEDFDETSFSD